ncbi:MAG: hypothetical protein EOP18_02230 [Rhizobiaceae bacterium]|nr:MAG: hypothetical protein EOP18_02230 [Rhizobiaceae bacterium]
MSEYCFLIQPFNEVFNKRYKSVFAPAIVAAGLTPYRIDEDHSVTVPIEDIEKKIEGAAICLADITEDNPNVWYELGYAIASRKLVCLVCSSKRGDTFPFDIRHRQIVRYTTDSPEDFAQLQTQITERIKATMKRQEGFASIQASNAPDEPLPDKLSELELSAILVLAMETNGTGAGVSHWSLQNGLEAAGYNKVGAVLAPRQLARRGMVNSHIETDRDGDEFAVYALTDPGWAAFEANASTMNIKATPKPTIPKESYDLNDDIPF